MRQIREQEEENEEKEEEEKKKKKKKRKRRVPWAAASGFQGPGVEDLKKNEIKKHKERKGRKKKINRVPRSKLETRKEKPCHVTVSLFSLSLSLFLFIYFYLSPVSRLRDAMNESLMIGRTQILVGFGSATASIPSALFFSFHQTANPKRRVAPTRTATSG